MWPFRKNIKLGVAFGGGGARGFAHVGAIKAFQEYGIEFDFVAGTSAGSIAGAFYAAGYNYDKILEICKKLDAKEIRNNKFFIMPSKTDGIQKIVKEALGDIDISELSKPFTAVAVDLKSTKEICISKGNLAKAVAGSCAVPGIFQPVEFEDMLLVDGGLHNNIPSDVVRNMGADVVVAVDVNKYRGGGTESAKVLDVVSASLGILMKESSLKGYLNADIVLKPEMKRFKSSKLEGMEDMIDEGYREAIDQIEQILALKSGKIKKAKKKPQFQEEIIYIK